jgi:alkylation response protein AidB-like acyl-CoA dehydrogenase
VSGTRSIFEREHLQFRDTVREFVAREIAPHHDRWVREGIVSREVYVEAAKQGLVGFSVPEEYGGLGVTDFRYNAIVTEELGRGGYHGPAFALHNDIVAPYLLGLADKDQKRRWLPGMASGELIFAMAMTEPGTGSDLAGVKSTARRDGADWILNGQKTFISNGILSDVVIVVARTDPDAGHRGLSLLVVERGMAGFERGRNLDKIGQHAQDTAELYLDNVRVPGSNLLGPEGSGFANLMKNLPYERMSVAANSWGAARAVLDTTIEYAQSRQAFGSPIGSFQANRFTLAEMETELDIAQVYLDDCVKRTLTDELSAVDAAKAKWWITELHKRVVDRCVQLHGGYGYMTEYPVARAYLDARIATIYGGTTEIMKEIIGRSMNL